MNDTVLELDLATPRRNAAIPFAFFRNHPDFTLIIFFGLHIPLGIAMSSSPGLATLHSTVVALVVLALAARRSPPQVIANAAAYVLGSEVLWRMTSANTFWEAAKYAVSSAFILALIQSRRMKTHDISLLFFALLLPSALLTYFNGPLEWRWRREMLSFNLSGPFALMVSVWFFSNIRLTKAQYYRLFCFAIAPLIAVAAITVYATATAEYLTFSDNSNFVTSGGFGPNQVSSILGLGLLLALLYLIAGKPGKVLGAALFLTAGAFAVQSAMTFSRGGLYCAGGALALASVALLRDPAARGKLLRVTIGAGLIGALVIAPRLNDFTGGALGARYSDAELTHRDSLVWTDIAVWEENILFGVGPGMARSIRGNSPHTEFSRLLAEHGLLGFFALLLLLAMAVQTVLRAHGPWEKAMAIAMVGWSFLFMLVYDMRLVAPGYVFGLSFVNFEPEPWAQ